MLVRDPHRRSKFAPKAHEGFMLSYGKDWHTYRGFNTYHNKVVETVDVRFDETNGSQREHLPPMLDEMSPEESIKLKATEDIIPTEESSEEVIPDHEENHAGAAEETGPEETAGAKQSRQPTHPRIANEVQVEKIIDDIRAPGPSRAQKLHIYLTFVGILHLSLTQSPLK